MFDSLIESGRPEMALTLLRELPAAIYDALALTHTNGRKARKPARANSTA